MEYREYLTLPPFAAPSGVREKSLTARLNELTLRHYDRCPEYRRILDAGHIVPGTARRVEEIPMLPVALFKEFELRSVAGEEVFKTMTSSGTTGQAVSKIFLDRTTAAGQQKVLVKIVSDFLGSKRLPMLILDSPSVISNREMFSARGAGILGFSIFGTDRTCALREDMSLDLDAVGKFLEKHGDQKFLMFGFTFMVWRHFYRELLRLSAKPDCRNGILIHGGGWKKLVSEAVTPQQFRQSLAEACGLLHIHDYYGMVEQTGCIYMECEYGHFHTSIFSDVIPRRSRDFSACDFGETGILQVLSVLPESYPGHSLLTEDEGVVLGQDDCPCGRKGKYFRVLGRLKNAEIRGCSDTYAAKF